MPFTGTGTGIENADDVFFSGISDNDTLSYNSATAKWNNAQPVTGGGGGTTGHSYGLPMVASSTSPANVKAMADYVCTGTNDQNVINAALDDTKVNGAGGVQLTGGIYFIHGPIIINRAQALRGIGMLTELRAVTNFNDAMIMNSGDGDNMITIADMYINGDYRGVDGIKLLNGPATFGQSGIDNRPWTNPDSLHWLSNLCIRAPGSASYQGRGVWLGTPSGSTGNSRGNRVTNVAVIQSYGNSIHLDASSDCKFIQSGGSTRDGGNGVGFYIGGGSNKFIQCKTAYTASHGWHVVSSRTHLTGCAAQDSGAHGFYLQNDAHLASCEADSSGRLLGGAGDGFVIDANNVMLDGCRAIDRNQTPSSRQRHGFNRISGNDIWVTGQAYSNTGSKLNNFPAGGGRYARVVGGGSIDSVG